MDPDTLRNTVEQNDKANGFFTLPRELRDKIYDAARDDYQQGDDVVKFEFRAAIPTLRLVSRQFTHEYEERSAVNTFVRVFDLNNWCKFERLPRLAIKSRHLESVCDGGNDEFKLSSGYEPFLEDRLKSLERLAGHLPEVEEVHVQLVQYGTDDLTRCRGSTDHVLTSDQLFHQKCRFLDYRSDR